MRYVFVHPQIGTGLSAVRRRRAPRKRGKKKVRAEKTKKRYVPVDDLLAIYDRMYGHTGAHGVSAARISACTALLFLGRLGERVAIGKLFIKCACEYRAGTHTPKSTARLLSPLTACTCKYRAPINTVRL